VNIDNHARKMNEDALQESRLLAEEAILAFEIWSKTTAKIKY